MERHVVVSTKHLTASQLQYAQVLGLEAVSCPLFEEMPISGDDISSLMPKEIGTAIFTSPLAVPPIAHLADTLTGGPIFCVGTRAEQALQKLGLKPAAQGFESAEALAAFMVQFPLKLPMVHFCGAQRRPELRQVLQQSGVRLTEVPVYQMLPVLAPAFPAVYLGVLFFSPRGVARYLELVGMKELSSKNCFAIGATTASALLAVGIQPAALATYPSAKLLLQATAAFYKA